jgi:hypothetical protein
VKKVTDLGILITVSMSLIFFLFSSGPPIKTRLAVSGLVCLILMVFYGYPLPYILRIFYQYPEYFICFFVGFVTVLFLYYVRKYSKERYELAIIREIQHLSKRDPVAVHTKEWKKGVCEVLYDALIFLNIGNHHELFKRLKYAKEILEFTAKSKYAYYVMLSLETTDGLEKVFLEKKARQISDIMRFKWILPPIPSRVDVFLKSLIREIDDQFYICKSDLATISFSESVIPSSEKEYLTIRKITCLNFQLWERLSITSVKYESFLASIFFILFFLGLIWLENIYSYVLYFLYSAIFLNSFSGKSNIRRSLVSESLEFFDQTLNCGIREESITRKFLSWIVNRRSLGFLKKEPKSREYRFGNAQEIILSSGFLRNLELNNMTDEKRYLNLSILIYLITTFPKHKLADFTPAEKLDLSFDFELDEITRGDFFFALEIALRHLLISIRGVVETVRQEIHSEN